MLTPVPPTDCALARETASARLDGELAELQAAQLEAHLRACPECSAYAGAIEATTLELRAAPLLQPSGSVFTQRRPRRAGGFVSVAAAAAIVVAVAGSSFAVGGMLGSQGTHVPTPTTTETTALAGPIDQLVLQLQRGGALQGVQITSKIIAL
jgi:predicted anti-sigma-YlaC factor YlaD